MESRTDSEMADRILLKMNQPTQLVCTYVSVGTLVILCCSWMCVLDCTTKRQILRKESTEQITGKMRDVLKLWATIYLSLPNR